MNFSHNGVGEDLTVYGTRKIRPRYLLEDLEDILSVISDIHNLKRLQGRLLMGHSRGAGVSLIYALDHPEDIAGVISWNGITNVDLLTPENKAEMRDTGRSYTLNGRTKQLMPLDLEILEDMERNREKIPHPSSHPCGTISDYTNSRYRG